MAAAAVEDSFNEEVFNYWIPRLGADGVDANDVVEVRKKATGWGDWADAWAAAGDTHRKTAAERIAGGHRISAGELLVRASLCYHVGQVVAFHAPAQKAELQARKVAAFRAAAPLLLPPAERVDVPYRGHTLPGYLRLPAGAGGRVACALLVPGLDSTKEDFITVAEMCLRRGLAAFVFDGPGQGEFHAAMKLAEGYESAIAAVFDMLAARPEIDPKRIGLLGRSLGGFYIIRAAAANPRVAAAVVFGGAFDLSDWPTMPETIRGGFRFATGSASEAEARQKMGEASLADCIGRVRCPVLIVHGRRDAIFKAPQASRIADALGSRATLVVDEDGVHCCHNHAFQYRSLMADWLAKTL
ncbi:MAG: alpha/beta hydrolase [Alphaproteobacteria bacterium]|nr:alpha/beta hydrolase [Alphaproteobacteria bacterium]